MAPYNSDILYASSSLSYHSGGYDANSIGFIVSYDAGTTWATANEGMSWLHGGVMDIESGSDPHLWAWSSGTGIQHTAIPNYSTAAHISTSSACIEVYPNPFSDFVILDGDFAGYTIQILDVAGSVVSNLSNNTSPLKINLKDLNNGIYFISIQNDSLQDVSLTKIIKGEF